MKRILILVATVALVSGTGFAQGISGSAHDFSGEAWNSTGEICIVCHTPHNAMAVANAPLWNHEVTTATFSLYTSPTLDATVGQPAGASILCLSCHDGTVALENFSGATGGSNFVTGDALIGTDLSNDHPVSFTYNSALATTDGGLHDPSTTNSGLGGTITADMLFGDVMQCASCHDVHDAAGNTAMLLKPNSGSALCLTCHDK